MSTRVRRRLEESEDGAVAAPHGSEPVTPAQEAEKQRKKLMAEKSKTAAKAQKKSFERP